MSGRDHPPARRLCKQESGRLPFKCVFTLSPEVVDVGLEEQFEHVVLVNVLRLGGNGERVAQQRQAGEGVIVLQRTEVALRA